jgi:tRNA (guanine37-N1)-methyltransferase
LADPQRASHYLGCTVTPDTDAYHLHLVRRVAPNKDMYCLTFRLPRSVAFTASAA